MFLTSKYLASLTAVHRLRQVHRGILSDTAALQSTTPYSSVNTKPVAEIHGRWTALRSPASTDLRQLTKPPLRPSNFTQLSLFVILKNVYICWTYELVRPHVDRERWRLERPQAKTGSLNSFPTFSYLFMCVRNWLILLDRGVGMGCSMCWFKRPLADASTSSFLTKRSDFWFYCSTGIKLLSPMFRINFQTMLSIAKTEQI